MTPHLGSSKAIGLALYEKALHAPSKATADDYITQYSDNQEKYLSNFPKDRLYAAYSQLDDSVFTSQAADSQMNSSLWNQIRSA